MDEGSSARIIPLHRAQSASAINRARRLAAGRPSRPTPGPGASIHALATGAAQPDGTTGSSATLTPVDHGLAARVGGGLGAVEQRVADTLEFLRRRAGGEYPVDEFGFDADLTDNALLPAAAALYDRWFRVEVGGADNLPVEGGALLVANHAGGLWALDAVMTAVAVHREHPAGRHLRMLGADLIFKAPVVGELARKLGVTFACSADAERLLSSGELVGVWPEGFKGIGKPFRDRYKLQRFGRGGFVQAAVRSGVPIVPVTIIGSEEIHPLLHNAKTLARVLNLPYFPITPTFPWLGPLGLVPLPSKWYIEFGAPIRTDELGAEAADDAMAVFDLTDRVRETIQSNIYRLLVQRRSVWR